MPKSDASLRVEKYETKRTVSMPAAYEAMVSKREPRTENIGARAKLDELVAGILNRHNVPSNFRIPYHNFARKIEKLKRTNALVASSVEAALAYWEALGCERAILEEIVQAITGAEQ